MSHPQPTTESAHELSVYALDPGYHAIVSSDKQQDLVFRSIRAIDSRALEPHGVVSRAMIKLDDAETTVVFNAALRTGQYIQVYVPIEAWRLGNCDSEAVRAALLTAYVNLLGQKPGSVIVGRGTVSAEIVEYKPQKQSPRDFMRRRPKNRRHVEADRLGVKESKGGDIGGREEGNRSASASASASASGKLTYSESCSSASSYRSEKSASEHAAEPSTSTKPAAQETAPLAHLHDSLLDSELSVSTAASPGLTHTREDMSTGETGRTTTTRSALTVPRSLLNGSSAAATRIPPSLQAKMAALASKSQQSSVSRANLNGNNTTNGIDPTISALLRASLNDRRSLNPNGSSALSTPGLGAAGMAGRMPMNGMAARRAKSSLKLSDMQGFGSTPQAFGLRDGRPAGPGPSSRRAPHHDLGTPFASVSKIVDPPGAPYALSETTAAHLVPSSPRETQVLSKTLVGDMDRKLIDRVKEWRDRKRKGRGKADKRGSSHRKETSNGDMGRREEGNRSGSGSGSGELTYSESRSSASSHTSEKSASEHAAEPSTSTKPAMQGTVPPNHLHQSSPFGKRETSTPYKVPGFEHVGGGRSGFDPTRQDIIDDTG